MIEYGIVATVNLFGQNNWVFLFLDIYLKLQLMSVNMKKSELRQIIREELNKEHHLESMEEQRQWIHENLDKCDDENVINKIYMFLEKCLGISENINEMQDDIDFLKLEFPNADYDENNKKILAVLANNKIIDKSDVGSYLKDMKKSARYQPDIFKVNVYHKPGKTSNVYLNKDMIKDVKKIANEMQKVIGKAKISTEKLKKNGAY